MAYRIDIYQPGHFEPGDEEAVRVTVEHAPKEQVRALMQHLAKETADLVGGDDAVFVTTTHPNGVEVIEAAGWTHRLEEVDEPLDTIVERDPEFEEYIHAYDEVVK